MNMNEFMMQQVESEYKSFQAVKDYENDLTRSLSKNVSLDETIREVNFYRSYPIIANPKKDVCELCGKTTYVHATEFDEEELWLCNSCKQDLFY